MKDLIKKVFEVRVFRFLFSGGTAFLTNAGTLFVLVNYFDVWYLPASVFSFLLAVYVSFTLQKSYTFNDYTKDTVNQQSAYYFGIQLFNVFFNTGMLYVGVEILNIHYIIALFFISGFIATYNFFLYKYLVFNPDSAREDQ